MSRKQPRLDIDVQKRNRKTRREEGALKKVDKGTIVVKMGIVVCSHLLADFNIERRSQ